MLATWRVWLQILHWHEKKWHRPDAFTRYTLPIPQRTLSSYDATHHICTSAGRVRVWIACSLAPPHRPPIGEDNHFKTIQLKPDGEWLHEIVHIWARQVGELDMEFESRVEPAPLKWLIGGLLAIWACSLVMHLWYCSLVSLSCNCLDQTISFVSHVYILYPAQDSVLECRGGRLAQHWEPTRGLVVRHVRD